MTRTAFPHLPPGTELSDPRKLRLCAALPEVSPGRTPPPRCPSCGSSSIPPEESGMDFPEGTVVYECMGAYAPAEQDEEARENPQEWEALPPCWKVSAERALEFVSSWCGRHPAQLPVSKVLQGVSTGSAPVLAERGPGVWLMLQELKSEHPPAACPICGSGVTVQDPSFVRYECDALFSVTSQGPDAEGSLIPETWGGEQPCRKPSLRQLLTVLGARFPNASRAADACMRAVQLVRE